MPEVLFFPQLTLFSTLLNKVVKCKTIDLFFDIFKLPFLLDNIIFP